MAPIIREFEIEDYERSAQLWQACGIRVDSLDDIRLKQRRDPDLMLVAEVDGRLVGIVIGAFDGRLGSIHRLAVAEDQRRSGLATQLVEVVERRLHQKGARRLWAWIEGDNAASRALFAGDGYEEWSNVVTVSKSLIE